MSEQRYPVDCGLIVTAESAKEAAAKVAAMLSVCGDALGIRPVIVGVRRAIDSETAPRAPQAPETPPELKPDRSAEAQDSRVLFARIMGGPTFDSGDVA